MAGCYSDTLLDNPGKALELIQASEKPLIIVGHLPHLGRLASLLILGIPDKEIVKFTMGGVICLDRSDDVWSIQWAITLIREYSSRGKAI